MNKRVLMSLVALIAIGTSAVYAQEPTLDKLKFTLTSNNKGASVVQMDNKVSGAVVIPDTYNGTPVTEIGLSAFQLNANITSVIIGRNVETIRMYAFNGATGLASVTIPASVKTIGDRGFLNSTSSKGLTSVTFESGSVSFVAGSFTGGADLLAKYQAGGAGTYTRRQGENIWAKQGGTPNVTPAAAPAANTSLNGVWKRSDNSETVTINGSSGVFSGLNKPEGLGKDTVDKGYFKVGGQRFRNLKSAGNLTWSGQILNVTYNSSSPNVATGTQWGSTTITMSEDGKTITVNGSIIFTRQ